MNLPEFPVLANETDEFKEYVFLRTEPGQTVVGFRLRTTRDYHTKTELYLMIGGRNIFVAPEREQSVLEHFGLRKEVKGSLQDAMATSLVPINQAADPDPENHDACEVSMRRDQSVQWTHPALRQDN